MGAKNGANGIWAALIPQAAQGGHNSYLPFFASLVNQGNSHCFNSFHLRQAMQCARHVYYLNFNTYAVPDDCPIFGKRPPAQVHSAFDKGLEGNKWRQRLTSHWDDWTPDQKKKFKYESNFEEKKASGDCSYRISPLVS